MPAFIISFAMDCIVCMSAGTRTRSFIIFMTSVLLLRVPATRTMPSCSVNCAFCKQHKEGQPTAPRLRKESKLVVAPSSAGTLLSSQTHHGHQMSVVDIKPGNDFLGPHYLFCKSLGAAHVSPLCSFSHLPQNLLNRTIFLGRTVHSTCVAVPVLNIHLLACRKPW